MGDPTVQLGAVEKTTAEIRGIAEQALKWVRTSEERVADTEKRVADTEKELAASGARAQEESAELRKRHCTSSGRRDAVGSPRNARDGARRRLAPPARSRLATAQ